MVQRRRGFEVQTWILKPPNFNPAKKYPLLLAIHGGPQGVWSDAMSYRWNGQVFAAQGYVVMMPNPRGSTTFGSSSSTTSATTGVARSMRI